MSTYFILNLLFFQALWFASVVAAGGYQWHWLAIASLMPITVLTLFSEHRRLDFTQALFMVCVGLCLDNIWVQFGILVYPENYYAPYWIGILWFGLGLTINHSMKWFRDLGWVGALIVGAFAPVTYLTGQNFGAVSVPDLMATAWISGSWFVLFGAVAKFSRTYLTDALADATNNGNQAIEPATLAANQGNRTKTPTRPHRAT